MTKNMHLLQCVLVVAKVLPQSSREYRRLRND
jgi:hypothetical protein